jgi:hypothetical protein
MMPNPSATAQPKQELTLTDKNKKTILRMARDKLMAKGIEYTVFVADEDIHGC